MTVRSKPQTNTHRLMVSLPIFAILVGVLVSTSDLTTVPWNIEPVSQSMTTLANDTEVTFDNPPGEALPAKGTYKVIRRYIALDMTRNGNLTKESGDRGKANTDGGQAIRVLTQGPQNTSGERPGVVFVYGAGYGICDNSFGDVASDTVSAGFMTTVLDKPIQNATDINRGYPAPAKTYDQVVEYLRDRSDVDEAKVGIYATSESTWIPSYLLEDDPDIAFQTFLSPMVSSPRQSLRFFVTQDFTLAGASEGYQSIVQRVFSADTDLFGLGNFNLAIPKPVAYAVPTYVTYGSKDVMTAQVDGVCAILYNAHKANSWNVTVHSYPVANHVLRLGDESEAGTPSADVYVDDLIDQAIGTSAGLTQAGEKMAGTNLYQSIDLPGALRVRRVGTIHGVILHVTVILLLLAFIVLALVALGRRIAADARWRREKREAKHMGMLMPGRPVVLGFAHGFGNTLLALTPTTLATLFIFFAGLGQVVTGVIKLAWGSAPTETPGVMHRSWPVIQVVSVLVLWARSCIFMHLVEAASIRGLIQIPSRRESVRDIVTGADPVLASTRLGRILFWLVTFTMPYILLVFAFWGLFIYWLLH